MRDQLIAKYTFDPSTGGFGIYLVLWSEADIPYGSIPPEFRPASPRDLRCKLIAQLSEEESRMISVHVVDVRRLLFDSP